VAHEAGVELPAAVVLRRLYDTAAASGLHEADIAAVAELYRAPATAGGPRRA
jgi:3-hydroxyisobutyrate dehydrogenase-like beta-hydroxyacid dehydrogenase